MAECSVCEWLKGFIELEIDHAEAWLSLSTGCEEKNVRSLLGRLNDCFVKVRDLPKEDIT
jgi:hypothetical protein